VKQPVVSLPFRQVHLDFHTGPWIKDVGRDFNARDFARTMKAAHVNSVTVFAKCHHGHLYYTTKRPERHPGLRPGLNLLGEQVEALHREGIRAPIYISVQCDEYAADTHPEWIAREADGRPVGAGPLNPGWQILDMSSPYQDFLAEQTAEVLKLFKPVDGLFFDMCWDQTSLNNYTVDAMQQANLNPENENDRKLFSHRVSLAYMKRFHAMTLAASPKATVYFNSRPLWNLAEEAPYLSQVEIEALPTGGWGYMYFPKNVRFARNFGLQYMGMTARFHKSWADFGGLKPYPALEYEMCQSVAHGARCSIGDQLHPRGRLDKAAYELIGTVYQRIEEHEPWLRDAQPVVQIGVLRVAAPGTWALSNDENRALDGVTRMLTQLKHQFDIITPENDWAPYELLVLPDGIRVDAALARRLKAFLKNGGALLATGTSGLNAEGTELTLPELGVKPHGLSPFTTTYFRFGKEIADRAPATDHVMYDRGVRLTPLRGARSLGRVVEPYFERGWRHFSSHNQTPSATVSRYSAAVLNGNTATIAYPIFTAFAQHGNWTYRRLVENVLKLLLPQPLVRADAPTSTEVTVLRQRGRTLVHLLQYCPERRTPNLDIVEDIVPLYDVPLSVKLPRAPRSAYLAPEQTLLPFSWQDGRADVCVPEIHGHQMVVFE
jgi:hypothetical protein